MKLLCVSHCSNINNWKPNIFPLYLHVHEDVQTVEDHIYLLASAPKEDILFSTMKRAFLGPKVEAEMCNPY